MLVFLICSRSTIQHRVALEFNKRTARHVILGGWEVRKWLSAAASALLANVRCQVDEREDSESAEWQQWVGSGRSQRARALLQCVRPKSVKNGHPPKKRKRQNRAQ
jgi:hypothetical protein